MLGVKFVGEVFNIWAHSEYAEPSPNPTPNPTDTQRAVGLPDATINIADWSNWWRG